MSRRCKVVDISRWLTIRNRTVARSGGANSSRVMIRFQRLEASLDVVWRLHAFAHVVEKQGEVEKFRLLEFFEDLGESIFPITPLVVPRKRDRVLWIPACAGMTGRDDRDRERVQVLNGHEGVLVHRVAVKEVPDDQRINRLELREKSAQHAQPIHLPQGLGRSRETGVFGESGPKLRPGPGG